MVDELTDVLADVLGDTTGSSGGGTTYTSTTTFSLNSPKGGTPVMNYIFGNLRTGLVLEELPLQGVSMSRQLNASGTFRGSIALDISGKDNATMVDATTPGRCFVCAERNGWPVWYGIVWSRVYQSQAKTLEITASTLERYPERRYVTSDMVFDDLEQRNIFVYLWNSLQSTSEGNMGIVVPSPFLTVKTKDLTVMAADWKTYQQAMSSVADGSDGFDWTIDISKSSTGSYTKTLRIGYPTLGLSGSAVPWQFEYPGSILNYYCTDGMGSAGTNITVFGTDAEDAPVMYSTYIHSDLLSGASWPRYDLGITRRWLNAQAQLDSFASLEGPKLRPPLSVFKAFVKGDLSPDFGSYNLGDQATLIIRDPRFPNTLQKTVRIVGWDYTPPRSDATEEVDITFAGDEVNDE